MRTVSFSDPEVQDALNNDFVSTYTNTTGDPSAGHSFSHPPEDSPGTCGFGAGKQNVQAIFMTPAGEIFHVASGFRDSSSLMDEINFASRVFEKLEDSTDREGAVADMQIERLADLGFDRNAIERGSVGLMSMMPTGSRPDFAPQDLGIEVPSAGMSGMDVFQDMIRQRVLTDGTFVARNPLMSKESFDANPEELVGNGTSFFGSHSSMNNFSSGDGMPGGMFRTLPGGMPNGTSGNLPGNMSDFQEQFQNMRDRSRAGMMRMRGGR